MKKFFIKTLGCKTNQTESDLMAQKLVAQGFEQVYKSDCADIFILNSCSVTQNADNEALNILKKIKSQSPSTKTVIAGCFAQLAADELRGLDYIDLVLGNSEKLHIDKYLNFDKKTNVKNIFDEHEFVHQNVIKHKRTRAYLKIQDGCDNRCSYCTIWIARGHSRSNSVANIISQVDEYVKKGFKEVVLIGIHIGQWGSDFKDKKSLGHLLEEIEKTDIERYRLGSLNPLEIDDTLLDFLAKSKKFCPHFHLSLQSACNKTLEAMNRKYTVESYLELINKINSKFNNPFLGSDIIVGFPEEADEDFEITYQNLEKSGLSQIHVFPYSLRKNTKAAELAQIPLETKKKRAKKLQLLSDRKLADFLQQNIGSVQDVLFEKNIDKKTGCYKGLTPNYITVLLKSDKDVSSKIFKVKLQDEIDGKIYCKFM